MQTLLKNLKTSLKKTVFNSYGYLTFEEVIMYSLKSSISYKLGNIAKVRKKEAGRIKKRGIRSVIYSSGFFFTGPWASIYVGSIYSRLTAAHSHSYKQVEENRSLLIQNLIICSAGPYTKQTLWSLCSCTLTPSIFPPPLSFYI